MANYYGTCRTNYFRVTDEEAYKKLFKGLVGEDTINDFTQTDKDGVLRHGFGSYGTIDWYDVTKYDSFSDAYDSSDFINLDGFFAEIQKILPENDVFIFMESGYEKLRYVVGYVVVVSKKEIRYMNLGDWALNTARTMLGDKGYKTQMEY